MSVAADGVPPSGPAPTGHRRQVLLNTLASVLANGWAIILSLIALPLLLRGLGSDAFGSWVLLLTFSATNGWLSLADVGLATATVRATAHHHSTGDRDRFGAILGTSLTLYLATAVVCGIAFELIAPWALPQLFNTPADLQAEMTTAIRFFGAQIVFDLLSVGMMAALEGGLRLDLARAVDSTNRTLTTVAAVVVALAGGGLAGVAAASFGASVVAFGVAVVLLTRTLRVRYSFDRREAGELIRYGAEIGVLRGTGVMHRTMDRLIVGIILGPASVTIVEIATQVQNGASAILSATTQATTASASWLRARMARDTLRELLLSGTRYSTLVTWPVSVVLMVLAAPIVGLWVGSSYDAAVVPLVLAMTYLISQIPLQTGSNLLMGIGRARSVIFPALLGIVVNLVTSVVLVNRIGVNGAFIGTLIGGTVMTPALLRNVLADTELTLGRFCREAVVPAVPVALACAAGAGAVLLLPLGNLLTVVLGTALGLGLATFVGVRWATTTQERTGLWRTLRGSEV